MTDPMELVGRLTQRAADYRAGGPSSEHTAVMLDEAAACIREMVEWRPIETHPTEGSFLVIGGTMVSDLGGNIPCTEATKVIFIPADDYQEREGYEVVDTCYYSISVEGPTHWLPLPPAPGAEA